MIVSVPHTGTRSLQAHLNVATIFHFCQNEGDFVPIREHIDFPIRCPLATSLSWRSYQSDRTDMGEFRRWEKAIDYLADYAPGYTVHVMEKLPVVDGMSDPNSWYKQAYVNHDIAALKKFPEVEYLLEWYLQHEEFFKPYYPEGFWWHKKQATP